MSKKQPELPHMPPKNAVQKGAEEVVERLETVQDKQEDLKKAKLDLITKMKKAKITRIVVKDSTGQKRVVEYKPSEAIQVKKQSSNNN